MEFTEKPTYKIKRSTIATVLLILELIAIIILFAFLLKTVRSRYSELASERLISGIEGKLTSSIWKSITLLAQNGEDILSGDMKNNMGGYLILPVSYSEGRGLTHDKFKLNLSNMDKFNIYIGHPQTSLEHGLNIPFAITHRDEMEGGAEGGIVIAGVSEYLDGLAGRNVFCKIFSLGDETVIADTASFSDDFRFERIAQDFGVWKKAIPEFGIGIEVNAPLSSLETPLIPMVLVMLCFVLFASVIFFLHVRIVKPASMSVDLFDENRKNLEMDFPRGIIQENLFLNVDTLISAYNRLNESYTSVKKKLEEIEFGSLEELRRNHEELLIHHAITKKMLKTLNKQSITPILLDGVRELGFHNILWGEYVRDTMSLEFSLDPLIYGKGRITVPLLDETYFLSRVSWNGIYQFVDDASKLDCRYDDLMLISEDPSLIIPVLKNRRTRCYQFFKCSSTDCPAYMSSDQKCWLRASDKCDHHSGDPSKKSREACLSCPLFNVEGVLIVKRERGGREVRADNTGGIIGLVNEASLALEIADLYEETERLSVTDSLTCLFNHREFFKLLAGELDRANRFNTDLSLLMIDVDNFKIINDTYGHLAGDMALKMITDAINRAVRKIDIVSRYGGEEFTVILPETDQGGAIVLAERIKSEVASLNISPVADEKVTITVSIGICSCQGGAMTTDQIVSRADDAAYLAKKTGKNKICISDRI